MIKMSKENVVSTAIAAASVAFMVWAFGFITKQGVIGFCKLCVWLAKECA